MTSGSRALALVLLVSSGLLPACGGAEPQAVSSGEASASGAGTAPSTASVSGRLAPSLAPGGSLVLLEASTPGEMPVRTDMALMDQAGYEFLPGFLVAQAGQPVQFRNSEDVLHNVRVTETSQQKPVFNVATVAFGSYEHTFDAPGVYNVSCDIHPTMKATILITATPYAATAADDGTFALDDVQPGSYTLKVMGGASDVARPVTISTGAVDLGVIQ